MKLNGNAVKPGNVIEHNGRLWTAVKVSHVKPGKGGAFAQIELRDIRDGTKLNDDFDHLKRSSALFSMKMNVHFICRW